MGVHDIIDNRDEKLVDHINQILGSTEAAKFAVGCFFLSGLEAVAKNLAGVKRIRLLIGNTSSRETIEQIAEGYQRLELVASSEERERYLKRADQKRRAEETAGNLRHTLERMDQSEEAQGLVHTLIRMITEKRIDVRVFTNPPHISKRASEPSQRDFKRNERKGLRPEKNTTGRVWQQSCVSRGHAQCLSSTYNRF